MPGPGVGDIILQAAQGIVAMKQRRQSLALQQQQLDQKAQADKDASKSRDEGLKLREQNLKLQQDQLALSNERFDEQNRQFTVSQDQQQGQFDERLKVSQQNANTNLMNALKASAGADGKLDLEKATLELQKLQGQVKAQGQLSNQRQFDLGQDLSKEVLDRRWRGAQAEFQSDGAQDPNVKALYGSMKSSGDVQRGLADAIEVQSMWERIQASDPTTEIPQLSAAQAQVKNYRAIIDYQHEKRVNETPSVAEIRAVGDEKNLDPAAYGQTVVSVESTIGRVTGPNVSVTESVQLLDTGIRTGNYDALWDASVFNGMTRDELQSSPEFRDLWKALDARGATQEQKQSYIASFNARFKKPN